MANPWILTLANKWANKWVISTALIISPLAIASAHSEFYGIEVQGQSGVMVQPDSFALSIAVTEQGRFTDKIRAIVDDKSNQVVAIAKAQGISSDHISSASVSLRVIEAAKNIHLRKVEVNKNLPSEVKSKLHLNIRDGKRDASQVDHVIPQYFELSRRITVKFSNIDGYDDFLAKITKIGVSQISPLSMSVADTEKYYQQALSQALSNAKAKAQNLAKQADQSLGRLVSIKELSSNHYRAQYSAPMRSANSGFSHNSQVGNQSINASVLVKFTLEE
ncbi:hypothetical protein NBRC116592_14840 [Colwellia sp. KU-HH00111]|uniref:SIMPL domain-containing protein n=1 Tax=Colwellia sp. KU-HH00111 TaxID=3127652 RepID=UPI0031065E2A